VENLREKKYATFEDRPHMKKYADWLNLSQFTFTNAHVIADCTRLTLLLYKRYKIKNIFTRLQLGINNCTSGNGLSALQIIAVTS